MKMLLCICMDILHVNYGVIRLCRHDLFWCYTCLFHISLIIDRAAHVDQMSITSPRYYSYIYWDKFMGLKWFNNAPSRPLPRAVWRGWSVGLLNPTFKQNEESVSRYFLMPAVAKYLHRSAGASPHAIGMLGAPVSPPLI